MLSRRLFLTGTAASGLAAMFVRIGCRDKSASRKDLRLLELVVSAVLPSELSQTEHRLVAVGLLDWLDDHDPHAEPEQHSPYGYDPNARIRSPYPKEIILRNLHEIETLSKHKYSRSFENLELHKKQALLRSVVAQMRPNQMIEGSLYQENGHVVLSVLDFYYHHNHAIEHYRPDGYPNR